MILIGRSLVLLLRWFQDPDNKKKVEAIGRFLGDHWPKLLALFIAFGTGLGGFVRGLIGVVVKGTGALIKAAVSLAARAKLKGAGGALKFLGGPKGKLIGKAVQVAAVAGGTVALSKGLENFGGISGGEKESEPTVQKYSGGGKVKIPAFFGGGLNLSNMMKGASMGAMFGPLGMLLGGALGSGKPQQMVSGFVSGEKGVDKVPAMLTDGEFVMSAGAVRKYGVDTLEAMNAAGGGNNRPKVVSGTTYAWGGGLITDDQLRSQAAAQAAPTGGTEGAREYKFNSNNPDHIRNYETLKKKAISRGVYIDPIDPPQRSPKTSQQSARTSQQPPRTSQQPPRTSQQSTRTSQQPPRTSRPPGGRTPPPNTSSTSLMRRPTSALSTNVRTPMQSIRIDKNVPGGFGNLKSLGVEMLANYLMERGFDRINAIVIANKIDEGKKLTGDKRENYIEKLRNIVDREERWQKGFGGVFDSMIGLGRESLSQKKSKNARAVLEGIGSSAYTGGGIVGGYGLKDQSFRDAPKTQVMSDEKGRPFVGYKALLNGKLTYKRGPEPGTGSTNPLEIIGRALFPGAYTVNDARLADEKHKEALVNSLQSFRDRGMGEEGQTKMMKSLGGNIKDTQKDLDARQAKLSSGGGKSRSGGRGRGTSSSTARLAKGKTSSKSSGITPPSKPTVKVTTPKSKRQRGAHMKMNKGSASGSTVPKFSASSGSKNRGRNTALYGMGLM